MASQKLELQLKGLFLSPNNLSSVPQGALEVADNVVIDRIGIVESRRGQTQYGDILSIGDDQVNKLFNYNSTLIVNYADKMGYDSGNGVWITYSGTYIAPSTFNKMRSLEALRNFYFTTSKGIYKIDRLNTTPIPSGVVEALSGTYTLSGSSGFLEDDSAVAYRLVWTYTDANGNLLRGAPSQRLVVPNLSGTDKDVVLTYLIPDSITTEYRYQIYRSTAATSAQSEPDDELQLVLSSTVTSAEIAAKQFVVTDITPYSLMRETIYTAPSQQGIENANYQPPFAVDMDIFKNSAFYANVKQKQQSSLALIAVGTPALGYHGGANLFTTTIGSDVIRFDTSSTTDVHLGMRVVATNIPAGSIITEIIDSTNVKVSNLATATDTTGMEFQDRFSVGEQDYWAGSVNDPANNVFFVEDTITPGDNIDITAQNLIQIINTSPTNNSFYAYYLSGLEELPGQILFKERSIGGSELYYTSTAGFSFTPVLPVGNKITSNTVADPTVITSVNHGLTTGNIIRMFNSNSTPSINGTSVVTVIDPDTFTIPKNVTIAGTTGTFMIDSEAVVSSNDARQNRVYASKANEVESVPLYSYFDIGSANFPIERVVALRDGIFFFKQDGIYRLSGESYSSWTVSLVDNTVTLKVPESAQAFNNQIFCFTTQGVCAVTDSGVQIMSVPIENSLLELSSDQYTNFANASFGVAYESSRQYMFFTVSDETDTYATQAFIYNSLTKTWTRWIMDRTCGIVNVVTNKLFMAEADSGQVLVERKTFTNQDYADKQFDIVIDSIISPTEFEITGSSLVFEGMTLVQNDKPSVITSVDLINDIITINPTTIEYEVGPAEVYTPITNRVQWAPIDAENPGILKQFSEITLAFRNAAFSSIEAGFSSNISGTIRTVDIINNSGAAGFGNVPWSSGPFGGGLGGQVVLRTYVPREAQRCSWLTISLETREAFTGFSLQGISFIFNTMSSRFK